jgi:hypothetical protein
LSQTAENLLNRTSKQCNSHRLPRTLTESSRQQPAAPYKKTLITSDVKISPLSDEAERRLTKRKCSDGSEILTSSLFRVELEEKRQAKIDKAGQQRKRKETRGKNFLKKKSQKTRSHNASKRRLQFSAEADSEVDRPKETECVICDEFFDEDWIQCNSCS